MSVVEIVCPVCSLRQPNAWDCAGCGVALHDKPRHWQVPVEQVQGLQPTRLDPVNAAVLPLPELEPTAMELRADVVAAPVEGLETTSHGEAPELPTEALPLEPTSLAMPELSLPAGPTLCRYCGTPWQEQGSVFCVGCGMRVGSRPAPPESESEGKACASCGQQNQQAGTLCVQCGERVR